MRRVFVCLLALLFDSTPGSTAAVAAPTPGSMPQTMPAKPSPANAKGTRYKATISVSAPVITLDGVCVGARTDHQGGRIRQACYRQTSDFMQNGCDARRGVPGLA